MTIASSPDLISPLSHGGNVPDGPLVNMDGKETTLYEVLGTNPSIILFYRGEW